MPCLKPTLAMKPVLNCYLGKLQHLGGKRMENEFHLGWKLLKNHTPFPPHLDRIWDLVTGGERKHFLEKTTVQPPPPILPEGLRLLLNTGRTPTCTWRTWILNPRPLYSCTSICTQCTS